MLCWLGPQSLTLSFRPKPGLMSEARYISCAYPRQLSAYSLPVEKALSTQHWFLATHLPFSSCGWLCVVDHKIYVMVHAGLHETRFCFLLPLLSRYHMVAAHACVGEHVLLVCRQRQC